MRRPYLFMSALILTAAAAVAGSAAGKEPAPATTKAESGSSLTPPPGYVPDKKIVRLWDSKCATCHGEDGRAKTEQGASMGIGDMTKSAYWKDVTIESARKAVMDGLKRTVNGKEQEMKPFADRLKPQQVDALNMYAASFKK